MSTLSSQWSNSKRSWLSKPNILISFHHLRSGKPSLEQDFYFSKSHCPQLWLKHNCPPSQISDSLFFFFFNWRITALHGYVSFCCTRKWISHISPPSEASFPCPPSHPSRSSQRSEWSSPCHTRLPLALWEGRVLLMGMRWGARFIWKLFQTTLVLSLEKLK